MKVIQSPYDFSAIRPAMQRYVDKQILAGVSSAVLSGRDLVHLDCVGWADTESAIALRPDHLFRVFSNTKLITAMAVLMLMEEGRLKLDDAIEIYLPQLARRRVLRAGTLDVNDTEPARSPISIRHLLCHSSGLSYGWMDRNSTLYEPYAKLRVFQSLTPLADLIDALQDLPLAFHPGTSWEYSIASDVLARLVEVISGQRFDDFIHARILQPLGMHDTCFFVPQDQQHRLTAFYAGSDPMNLLGRGLKRIDHVPYPDAFLKPVERLSGGAGLVSSLPDMLALMRSLMPGGQGLLKPETLALMMQNHLPAGLGIAFPGVGQVPHKGYGLGGAVTLQPSADDPAATPGEFEWGGLAGTHWWISPRHNLAGILMTQRQMSFWHPFSFEFKRLVYQAAGLYQ